jgi:hypothetical protein
MAAKAVRPLDKEAWLKLAGDWLRLTDDADLRKNPRLVWLKVCLLITGQFS